MSSLARLPIQLYMNLESVRKPDFVPPGPTKMFPVWSKRLQNFCTKIPVWSKLFQIFCAKFPVWLKLLQNFSKPFPQPLAATSCFSTLVQLTWIRVTLEPIWTSQVELGSKHKVETGNGKQSKIKTQLRNWGRQT